MRIIHSLGNSSRKNFTNLPSVVSGFASYMVCGNNIWHGLMIWILVSKSEYHGLSPNWIRFMAGYWDKNEILLYDWCVRFAKKYIFEAVSTYYAHFRCLSMQFPLHCVHSLGQMLHLQCESIKKKFPIIIFFCLFGKLIGFYLLT